MIKSIRVIGLLAALFLSVNAFADSTSVAGAGAVSEGSAATLTFNNMYPSVQSLTTNGSIRVYQAPGFQAPVAPMTTPCATGYQATVTTPVGGGSVGSAKIDVICRKQSLGETAMAHGEQQAGLRVWCGIEDWFVANRDACKKIQIPSEYDRMNALYPEYVAAKPEAVFQSKTVQTKAAGPVGRK